jgi:L-ascorbate metabolism protein UlaG (beta-lactamase superfamily)
MKIKYLGHASFLIVSDSGARIVTDPYTIQPGFRYGPIDLPADIVTITHNHKDHNNATGVKGKPVIVKEAGAKTVKGIEIRGFPTFHDEDSGSQRGQNVIFCLKVDGMNVCHLGDLGHALNGMQLKELGPVDVLFVPVGGHFTIDAKQAGTVASETGAKVIIPMHFKNSKTDYPITPVEDFVSRKSNVRRPGSTEIELTKDNLPAKPEILVLEPSL